MRMPSRKPSAMRISTKTQKKAEVKKVINDINKRVGVLEKWRHVLIGGSIVIGFVLHKMMNFT